MLLTTLLVQHPDAALDIVRGTPAWVGALLAGLIVLGLSALRTRQMHPRQLTLLPLTMLGLALWGVQSAFGASGRLALLLGLWALCFAAMLAVGVRRAPPAGARYDAAAQRFRLPGSAVPLALIVSVFLLKYLIGVQLALEPALARHPEFAFAVTAAYGLLSGLFAARAWVVLRLARLPAGAAVAPH